MSEESAEIVLIPSESTPSKIETSIAAFSEPLANFLKHLGLPTDNILSPIQERRKVIYNLESTLEVLPLEERAKSEYLSKFAASITMGLFDGALTFLWDETINNLKKKTTNVHINKALYKITNFPRLALPKITSDSSYKEAIKYI
ncbi:hypothetical protein [uncultured Nostoc sp.]|uniref:hypothetical protein n=1 Tax=uncultured Nostoc sp. TaxID=340711 RepID=UPI0035CB91B2